MALRHSRNYNTKPDKQSDKVLTKPDHSVLFIRGLPREVHNQFKAFCARRGESMNSMITILIREAIRKEQA